MSDGRGTKSQGVDERQQQSDRQSDDLRDQGSLTRSLLGRQTTGQKQGMGYNGQQQRNTQQQDPWSSQNSLVSFMRKRNSCRTIKGRCNVDTLAFEKKKKKGRGVNAKVNFDGVPSFSLESIIYARAVNRRKCGA